MDKSLIDGGGWGVAPNEKTTFIEDSIIIGDGGSAGIGDIKPERGD